MLKTIVLLIILYSTQAQDLIYEIFPPQEFSQSTVSARVCFADCEFCQTNTGLCQDCNSPYFIKSNEGQCIINTNYTLQSSRNELQKGISFIPSSSWSNTITKICTGNPSLPLNIIGPFQSESLVYRRTISTHKYLVIKFMLIKMNWVDQSELTFRISNQFGATIFQTKLTNTPNIPKQTLCSNQDLVDQRFSLKIQMQDRQTSEITLLFDGHMRSNTAFWGISTFNIITGNCHSSCQDCNYSPDSNKCLSCRNFHVVTENGSCANCAQGFRQIVQGINDQCLKCAIQYQRCTRNQSICYYRDLSNLNNISCQFVDPGNYDDEKYINDTVFLGSLFTVDGRSQTQQCGEYSFIGLGQPRSTITRIFANVINHIALSISFNIFVIDQIQPFEKQPFILLVDNKVVQFLEVPLRATSNVCGNRTRFEVFTTFPPTKFFPHNRNQNINISISSNTSNWGIRDLRVVFRKCDQLCEQCTPTLGCKTCMQLFQLQDMLCSGCISGYGRFYELLSNIENNVCLMCSDPNCKRCENNYTECTQCIVGYYIFMNGCEKNPDYGTFIPIADPNWKYQPVNEPNNCTITFSDNSTVQFLIVQNFLRGTFQVPQTLIKTKVQFRLLKIDDWDPTDYLDFYINDFRVFHRNFTNRGNKICFIPGQNQQLMFEEILIQDNNQTLAIQFEAVSRNPRKFGISDFKIVPFGCENCQSFGFSYKAEYNVDVNLNIQIIFNRVYINNNPDQFKKIFKLMNGKIQIPYKIAFNDSVRYWLQAQPSQIIQQNLKVICLFPERVATNTIEPINAKPFFESPIKQSLITSQSRLLQQNIIPPLYAKFLDNNSTQVFIQRYEMLNPDKMGNAQRLKILFEVLSRIVIYLGFASFFFGFQTPFTHLMHNFQRIWVHIFVASLALHPLLKESLIGFRQTQDQNIAVNPSAWQAPLPDQLYFQAPAQYQQYYQDIGFFRNIYNIGFAFLAITIFYIVIRVILTWWTSPPRWLENSKFLRHLRFTFVKRPYFYFNSIIFYQYFTLTLACTLNFIDLVNRTSSEPFSAVNAVACIIAFIFATAYPTVSYFYLKFKAKQMYSEDNQIAYRNRYAEIFFRFLPKNIWKISSQNFKPIWTPQFLYNTFRFGQIWWTTIIVALMYSQPFAQAFLLMILNFFHLIIVLFSNEINYSSVYKVLKILQLSLFIGIQILALVSVSLLGNLTNQSFQTLGIVGIALIFGIVFLSFVRAIYTGYKIIKEYDDEPTNTNINIDQRRRKLEDCNSIESEIIEEQQELK